MYRSNCIFKPGNFQIYSSTEKGFWRFYDDTKIFSYNYIQDSKELFLHFADWLDIQNPIILSDKIVAKSSIYANITSLINGESILFCDNSDIDILQKYVDILQTKKPDIIFAIGGGSVLDKAKLVTASYALQSPIHKIILTNRNLPTRIPLIAIPTTFGTGSEVNMISHLSVNKNKQGVRKHWLAPSMAIIIAEIAMKVPWRLRLLCGIDAWLHAIEGLSLKTEISPLQKLILTEVIQLHHNNFYDYLESPNIENSANIATASLLSGLGLNNGRTGVLHAVAGPFEKISGLSHAESLLPFLSNVVKQTVNNSTQYSGLEKIKADIFYHLKYRILPCCNKLIATWDINLSKQDIELMCTESRKDAVALKESPFVIDHLLIENIYQVALQQWIR